jgi:hypothetical protein
MLAQGTNPYRFAQQMAYNISIRTPFYMQRSQEASIVPEIRTDDVYG